MSLTEANTESASTKPELAGRELLRHEMIEHIVQENKAFFRSQQINDPDISIEERRSIVAGILSDSEEKFLTRFGNFIRLNHLAYFEADTEIERSDDQCYEFNCLLKNIRTNLNNRKKIIKNRRYAALQQLIDQKEYFSEIEMMKREPCLYDHLIGQYLTDNERIRRDALNTDGPEFSNILLHGIEMRNIEELRKQQQRDEDAEEEEDNSESCEDDSGDSSKTNKDDMIDENLFPQIPPNYRRHWGDFDDESNSTPIAAQARSLMSVAQPNISSNQPKIVASDKSLKSKTHCKDVKQTYISADEKDLLREEFFSMMCENFLQGKDTTFDYTTVDDNSLYDDIETEDQDAEDKYFEASDEENDRISATTTNRGDESEDELDVYMKNISQNKC